MAKGGGSSNSTKILADILFNVDSKNANSSLKEIVEWLELTAQTAEDANQQIANLAAAMGKIKGSTKNISSQINNSNVTNISAAAGQSLVRTKSGSTLAYNPDNRRDQDKADQLHTQIIKQEQEYVKYLAELTAQVKERKEKTRLENQNYNQILANQTKYADAALTSANTASYLKTSRERLNNVTADYRTKRNTDDWVNASLNDMRTRAEYRKFKMENPYANGGYKRTIKYQAGMGFINAGTYLGRHISPPVANLMSTGAQIIGTSLSNPAAGVAIGIQQLTKALVDLGTASVKAYGEIDSLKTQMSVVFGNETQSNETFNELAKYATKSPFGVSETTELATLLKQSGVEATDLIDTLKMLGDTAGGNMEKMKRIANNYAQIVSIGKASMLDMRQFAYAGIPIFEKVSEELNVSQTALRKMISDGEVTSEVIQKVFKDMTSEGGIFFEATSKGAETLKAKLQNLKDTKQLALAGIGEMVLRTGEKNGNDGIANKYTGIAESFYDKINNLTTLKNLEKSVKSIENNSSEQTRIKELIEYYKRTKGLSDKEAKNDPIIQRLLSQLEMVSNVYDPDKQRSINTELYKSYRGEEVAEVSSLSYAISRKQELKDANTKLLQDKKDFQESQFILYDTLHEITQKQYEDEVSRNEKLYYQKKDINDTEIQFLTNQIEILKAQEKITENIRNSWKETQLIQKQQLYFDNVNISSKKSTSALSDLSTLKSMYKESDEYKQTEKNKENQRLKDSLALLKEIKDCVIEGTDIVDFSKVSGAKLAEYVKQGAVSARKLALTSDNPNAPKEWVPLKNQISSISDRLLTEGKKITDGDDYRRKAMRIAAPFNSYKLKDNAIDNMESFYIYLRDNFDSMTSEFRKESDKAKSDGKTLEADFWDSLIEEFNNSLNAIIAESDLEVGDINKLLNNNKKVFQPLWKRIISSATGIDTTAISDVTSSLDFYRGNLATRRNTGNTLSALLKEGMSVDTLQSLTSARTSKSTLKDDERGSVWQINWDETRNGMKDFVSKLSTSTTAIDTWTKGLEDERNTYADLLGSGILSAESNGVDKALYVSAKKLTEGWTSEGEMGVNAFGEQLFNEDGKLVKAIKDGVAMGEDNKPLANQNLKISGDIYTVLKKHLESIDKEIKDANKVSAKNSVLSGMQGNVLGAQIAYLGMRGSTKDLSNFITNNPEQYKKMLEQNINKGSFESIADLYTAYFEGGTEAVKAVEEAIKKTNSEVIGFMNSPEYKALLRASDNLDRTNSINDAYNQYMNLKGPSYNPNSLYSVSYFERKNREAIGLSGASISDLAKMRTASRDDKIKELQYLKSSGSTDTERITALEKEIELTETLAQKEMKRAIAEKAMADATDEMVEALENLTAQAGKDLFLQPFKQIGEYTLGTLMNVREWSNYLDDAGKGLKQIAAQMLSNMGAEMATAGFRIASAAALEQNWGVVAGGLALAGAGGFAAGMGSVLTESESQQDKTQAEIEKLENIKSDLADILEQARTDAMYYEKNLRHKTALGANSKFSYQSVNDAIIAPGGKVISTAPDDYLIATKTPQNFGNSAPNISFNVINNAGVTVKQQRSVGPDGSVSITAIIEEAVGNFIASDKSDDAFNARQARINGSRFVM